MPKHQSKVSLCGKQQVPIQRMDALGAESHLPGRFLSRDVENPAAIASRGGRDVEEECGLSHAGFSREQDYGPWY